MAEIHKALPGIILAVVKPVLLIGGRAQELVLAGALAASVDLQPRV